MKTKPILTSLFALVAAAALWHSGFPAGSRLNFCWLIAQIVLYTGLHLRLSDWNRNSSDTVEEVFHTARELSFYMVIVTGPLAVIRWQGFSSISQVSIIALVKATRWLSMLTFVSFLKAM